MAGHRRAEVTPGHDEVSSANPFAPANIAGSRPARSRLTAVAIRKRDQRPGSVIVIRSLNLIGGGLIDGVLGFFFLRFLGSIRTVTAIRFGRSLPVSPAPNKNFECHVVPLKKTGAAILLKKPSQQYSFLMYNYGTR